ncbi:3-dehydroquinate synthase [Psychrobium sp. 1_MG-2023]|uniref:3-dehydroquinate synthase n=1 Tax=Psychrobium sp. 1_MG-2023 TaxID=3062624 RepID=UPI000C328A27|nr:3-dehydroquinate synthase [Psychrobium sp. 1_MG-2023]MDP2560993.1 3-dehydroquinate synthase [Psychrobium sp. 1_MG-2023]PKF58287.1 3-dehydroquinate synthase [Alteromonadales bacterium alter-6D02]
MKQLNVQLGERSYPIYIGQQLLSNSELLTRHIKAKKVMVITNTTVAELYLEQTISSLTQADRIVDQVVLPDGESYKTLETLNLIFDGLLGGKHGRDTCIVALGGGVIGDMAGFAAACYQRGVAFIQIPTTLLSQVDSSVGGKTAVNHPLGKNMIGAFYQPHAVFIDIDCLQTLPAQEFAAGMAEVIKYGIIWDKTFFEWLQENNRAIESLDTSALIHMIARCCQIKADVVAQDERENGVRALLNLGHTFGHAIESEQGYGQWLHGEAVAAGTVIAAKTALLLGLITEQENKDIKAIFEQYNLPVTKPKGMDFASFIEHMSVDKKVLAGQLRFILPTSIGSAELVSNISDSILSSAIESH